MFDKSRHTVFDVLHEILTCDSSLLSWSCLRYCLRKEVSLPLLNHVGKFYDVLGFTYLLNCIRENRRHDEILPLTHSAQHNSLALLTFRKLYIQNASQLVSIFSATDSVL